MDLRAPRKLAKEHDRSEFDSGAPELDEWLKRYARQNQLANNATTYVTVTPDGQVMGYYAIAMSAYERLNAPAAVARGAPDPIPCILLARLAVDRRVQGMGVGANLLRDALVRALDLSESIGVRAVLVHCRDEHAKAFYLANAGFERCPAEGLQVMVSIKALRAYLAT